MRVSLSLFAVVVAVSMAGAASSQTSPSATADPLQKFVGQWRLDRPGSTVPAAPPPDSRAGGQRPGSSGRGGGRGVPGMGPIGFPGMGGGGQPNQDDQHRLDILRRRLSEAPETITISRNGVTLEFADSDGRSFTLKADGKKQDRITGDGEFKSRARLNGTALVVEDDFGDGAKAITTYTTMLYGDERLLEIQVTVEGLPTGPPRMPGGSSGGQRQPPNSSKRIYEFDK